MTYEEATTHLRDHGMLDDIGDLQMNPKGGGYVYWHRGSVVDLDGMFEVQTLEAIATYVKGTPRNAE